MACGAGCGVRRRHMAREARKIFILHGKELLSYTIRGAFDGEEEATKELLAYEHSTAPEEIQTRIVIR